MSPTFTTVGTAGAAFGGPCATTAATARLATSPIVNSARIKIPPRYRGVYPWNVRVVRIVRIVRVVRVVRVVRDVRDVRVVRDAQLQGDFGAGRPAERRTAVRNSFSEPSALLRPRRRAIGSSQKPVIGGYPRLKPSVSMTTDTPSGCCVNNVSVCARHR